MRPIALVAAILTAASACAEDLAVVVGIDKYDSLPKFAQLAGAANDARKMVTTLGAYGFKSDLCLGPRTTKVEILKAISSAAAKRPERFVFFFAGHGTSFAGAGGPIYGLVPSDTKSERDVLTADELYQAVNAVPAKSKTVILDACFAGGMARSIGRSRYLSWGEKSAGVTRKSADSLSHIARPGAVCYFTASLSTQEALEIEAADGPHGAFTYALTRAMDGKSSSWYDIKGKAAFTMSQILSDKASYARQTPLLSRDFEGLPAFQPPSPDRIVPALDTVFKCIQLAWPDPEALTFEIGGSAAHRENAVFVRPGAPFSLTITPKRAGHLVVIGHRAGRYYRIFPGGDISMMTVTAGQPLEFDGVSDLIGSDEMKAMLFEDRSAAVELVSALTTQGARVGDLYVKGIAGIRPDARIVTADVTFNTSAELFEGLEIADPSKLMRMLWKGARPCDRQLLTALDAGMRDYDPASSLDRPYEDELAVQSALSFALNATGADRMLFAPEIYAGLPSTPERASANFGKLNALALISLYPGCFKAP